MPRNDNPSKVHESASAYAALGSALVERLVDAAIAGYAASGPGVLYVRHAVDSLGWTYRPQIECVEELDEWPELDVILQGHDPTREVVIAVFDDGVEFYRFPRPH